MVKGRKIPLAPQGKSWCSGHQDYLDIGAFSKSKNTSRGVEILCKECKGKSQKKYYDRNRMKMLEVQFKHNYGITEKEYCNLLSEQNGVCAACKKPETRMVYGQVKRLAVDHCHTNCNVRGLLCSSCNQALGLLEEDPQRILGLLDYVNSWNRNEG